LHVISQAQGRMDIVSEEGKGTQVEIWLPIVHMAEFNANVTGDVANVLLLDDDDEWAQNFVKVLADAGINATRQDKLDQLSQADLIFVEEYSALLSMEDVLASVKKADLADKTIVLTAALNPERVTHYLNEGLRDVQPKPYMAQEVAVLLK
jgi:DNA-binding NtrC family response regulator